MNLSQTADYGLRAFTGNGNQVRIGFTSPTTIYEKMRQMQSFAQALDLNVDQYVSDPVFKSAWRTWYDNTWKPFYEKYAGPNASSQQKLGVVFYSDELASQTESYRQQLNNFENDYHRQRTLSGQPVPNVPGTAPDPAPIQALAPGLPWYVWVIGGVAITVLGYFAVQKLRTNLRFLSPARRDPEIPSTF
jgi:hypothetical protein